MATLTDENIEAIKADNTILEAALKVLSLGLDSLCGACLDEKGDIKAPDRKELMKARSLLPPYCKNTLTKPKG